MILPAKEADDGLHRVSGRRGGDAGRAEIGDRRPGLAARLRGVEARKVVRYAALAVFTAALWQVAIRLSWALWAVTR